MNNRQLETLVWVLIYGGLLALCLGWFVQPRDAALGTLLMGGGGGVTVLGILLIVLRSRRRS